MLISEICLAMKFISDDSSSATKTVVAIDKEVKSKSDDTPFITAQTAVICVPPARVTGTLLPITIPATAGIIGSPTASTASNGLCLSSPALYPESFRPFSTTLCLST